MATSIEETLCSTADNEIEKEAVINFISTQVVAVDGSDTFYLYGSIRPRFRKIFVRSATEYAQLCGPRSTKMCNYGCNSCYHSIPSSENRFKQFKRYNSTEKVLLCVVIGAPRYVVGLKFLLKIYGKSKIPLTESYASF